MHAAMHACVHACALAHTQTKRTNNVRTNRTNERMQSHTHARSESTEHIQLVSTNSVINRLRSFNKRILVKAWNCSGPILLTFRTLSTAAGPAISFVSRTTRSIRSSGYGLPIFSITLTRERTCLANEVCILGVWSWRDVSIRLPQFSSPSWYSLWS